MWIPQVIVLAAHALSLSIACVDAYTWSSTVPTAPCAVRVLRRYVRRWSVVSSAAVTKDAAAFSRAAPASTGTGGDAAYGRMARIGSRDFVLAFTPSDFFSRAETKLAGLTLNQIEAFSQIPASEKVTGNSTTTTIIVKYVPGFLAKQNQRKFYAATQSSVHAERIVRTGPSTVILTGVPDALKAASTLAASRVEVLSVEFGKKRKHWTVQGSQLELGNVPQTSLIASSNWWGTGLTRAVMDLDELDTSHCFFYDSANPVLYAAVSGSPLTLALNAHKKIAAYVAVCTDAGSTCVSGVMTNPNQGSSSDTHATHVSGIAVGQPCAGLQGVAPGARVLFLAIPQGSEAETLAVPSDLWPAFATAANANASSLTASFGGACDGEYDDMAAQFDYAASALNLVMTIAAGNCGDESPSGISSPAVALNALSVGPSELPSSAYADGSRGFGNVATAPTGTYVPGNVASFGSQGPLPTGRSAPIIAAPGIQVLSSLADPSAGPNHATFTLMSGTSMAAPAVPVQAAQSMLARYGFPRAPASLVRAAIVASAIPCVGVVEVTSSACILIPSEQPNTRCGFGVPFLPQNALLGVDPAWEFITSQVSTTTTFCFNAGSNALVNATLVWDEPPHVPGSSDAIYDPLSLFISVIGQGSAAASQTDALNNHKRSSVQLSSSSPTFVRVTVVSQLGELEAEYAAGTSAPTASPAPSAAAGLNPVSFSLVVRGTSGAASSSSACGLCSTNEPPVPCFVANGTGAAACSSPTSGFGPCYPTSCDPGFVFSVDGLGCALYENVAVKDASCVAPLAFNGTQCVCLTPLISCGSGGSVQCGSLGYGACPVLAAAANPREYETPGINGTTPQSTSVAVEIGSWVGFGLSVALFVLLIAAGVAAASRSSSSSSTTTTPVEENFDKPDPSRVLGSSSLTHAGLIEIVGLAGCACSATFVDFYVVWFLLMVWLVLILLHVTAARFQLDRGPTTGSFWVLTTYYAAQYSIGSGLLIGFTALQLPTAVLMAVAYVIVIGVLGFIVIADLRDEVIFVVLFLLTLLFLGFAIAAAVQNEWAEFGGDIVLAAALGVLTVAMCKYKIDHRALAVGKSVVMPGREPLLESRGPMLHPGQGDGIPSASAGASELPTVSGGALPRPRRLI